MKKLLNSKRAQAISVNMLSVFAILIVATAITLAIGAEILDDTKDEFGVESRNVNETIVSTNDTIISITSVTTPNTLGTVLVYNETGRTTQILPGNYTVSTSNYSIDIHYVSGGDDLGFTDGDSWYLSYDIGYVETSAYNSTISGLKGVGTMADWLDTIALVLVAVVVIGLLAYFGKEGGR